MATGAGVSRRARGLTVVDLQTHTNPASFCSFMTAEELVERAIEVGLDAVAVTDHEAIEGADLAWEIGRRRGLTVFRGVEVSSTLGDVLIYGCRRAFPAGSPIEELAAEVHQLGGVVFKAHPFRARGGLNIPYYFYKYDLRFPDDYPRLPGLLALDGLEVLNGLSSAEENRRAEEFARSIGAAGIGGSDAHRLEQIGSCVTVFDGNVRSEADFVAALRAGRGRAAAGAAVGLAVRGLTR